jgi:hypothetical protein
MGANLYNLVPGGSLILVEIFWTAETRTKIVVEKRLPALENVEKICSGWRRKMLL